MIYNSEWRNVFKEPKMKITFVITYYTTQITNIATPWQVVHGHNSLLKPLYRPS